MVMKVLIIAFGHPDNVLSFSRELSKHIDLTVAFVISSNPYREGVMNLDVSQLSYGLNKNQEQNLKLLPEGIQKFIGKNLTLYFIRTYNRKVFKDFKLKNYRSLRKTIYEIKADNFDLIHFNGNSGFLLYFVPLLRSFPKVWTLHDYKGHSGEKNLKAFLINIFTSRFIMHFIQHYEYLNQQFIATYKLNRNKVHTIYSGSFDVYKYFTKRNPGILKKKYILFFGRISPYKNIDLLLNAYERIALTEKPNLIIAGAGKFWFDISKYKSNPKIEILNRYIESDELVYLIQNSLYIAAPYKDATHSGVIATAYAFNKPVIATNVSGLSEIIKNKETGILVRPDDPDSLSKAIIHLVKHPEQLEIYKKNIIDLKKNGIFSCDNISRKYIRIYKSIISN